MQLVKRSPGLTDKLKVIMSWVMCLSCASFLIYNYNRFNEEVTWSSHFYFREFCMEQNYILHFLNELFYLLYNYGERKYAVTPLNCLYVTL